jgi:hypothetical protein
MTTLLKHCVLALIAAAIWASPIQVMPAAAAATDAKPRVGEISEEVARARITAAGYGEIKTLQREGQYYVVETSRGGQPLRIKVDVMTGQISPVSP